MTTHGLGPRLFTDTVDVDHHLLWLSEPHAEGPPPTDAANGLIVSRPGIGVILTGIGSGRVTVTVQRRLNPPPTVETAGWDEVVDHTFHSREGKVRVHSVDGPLPKLPPLTPWGAGTYRLRVHARGRDTAPDGVAFTPVEHYLIVSWPAPPEPDHAHLHTDHVGAGWRASAATAPPAPGRDPCHERPEDLPPRSRADTEWPSAPPAP
jgi:hypothetical protein